MTHQFPITVYYEDTDMGGVVYHANYFKYIERARSAIVADLGVDQNALRASGVVFVVTRTEADFLAPARMGDTLSVVTQHAAASPARWAFEQEVRRADQVLFRASVVAVAMTTEGKPTRLPAEIRAQT